MAVLSLTSPVPLRAHGLCFRYEARKQKLTESESASSLEALEQKLRHYEQNIFNLSEYIESKTCAAHMLLCMQALTCVHAISHTGARTHA